MEGIITELDLKESLVMLVLRVCLVTMEDPVHLEILAEGDLMAEEEHLGNLEALVDLEKRVSLVSLASQDLEDHQDQTDRRDSKERKETPGPGGLEEALVQLEKREDEERLVVRENLEIQDQKVFRGQWVQEENPEKMAEMGLELLDLKEERETKASQDSQDLKEQLVILELKVDQAKEETEDRGVSLETWVHLVKEERSDILGLKERKVLEVLELCNATWLRRSEITVLVATAKRNALCTPQSLPLPWTYRKTWAPPSTACARLCSTWSKTSPSLRATVPEALAWLWSCTTMRSPQRCGLPIT